MEQKEFDKNINTDTNHETEDNNIRFHKHERCERVYAKKQK